MIIAGHQSHYLPWIGYFSKMLQADKFCIVDNIQFEKKGFQNRNKIRTNNGVATLTIPVITHNKFDQKINEVKIDNTVPWKRKHWKSIKLAYQKAPYFNEYSGFFEDVYKREWSYLVDINEHMIKGVMKFLDINKEVLLSSKLDAKGQKTELLIDICKKTNSTGYLSGTGGAKSYVNEQRFVEENLTHQFQKFKHPVYSQIQGGEFVSKLAILDLLFNKGPESGRIIREASVVPW